MARTQKVKTTDAATPKVVISDASVVIGLAGLSDFGGLAWLTPLFGEVWITPTVLSEVMPHATARFVSDIQLAIANQHLKVWPTAVVDLEDEPTLDPGERECIALALSLKKSHHDVLLLIDERIGRCVCSEKGIKVMGTAAIILGAKRLGLIQKVRPALEKLHASGFRLSVRLIENVLKIAKEMN